MITDLKISDSKNLEKMLSKARKEGVDLEEDIDDVEIREVKVYDYLLIDVLTRFDVS